MKLDQLAFNWRQNQSSSESEKKSEKGIEKFNAELVFRCNNFFSIRFHDVLEKVREYLSWHDSTSFTPGSNMWWSMLINDTYGRIKKRDDPENWKKAKDLILEIMEIEKPGFLKELHK